MKKNDYISNQDIAKVAIIVANEADKFKAKELTYFGFNNDAAHVPMIDGEKLDFERINDLDKDGEFFVNTSDHNSQAKYFDKVKMKSNYDPTDRYKSQEAMVSLPTRQNMRFVVSSIPVVYVYRKNGHFDDVTINQIFTSEPGTVIDCGEYFQCHVKNDDIKFTILYEGSKPVIAKMEMFECDLKEKPQGYEVRQDSEFAYICSNDGGDGGQIELNFVRAKEATQWPALSYVNDKLLTEATDCLDMPRPLSKLAAESDHQRVDGAVCNILLLSLDA